MTNEPLPPHAARPAAGRPPVEHTRWSWGLVGFYVSCACVALGAGIAAASHWFFRAAAGVWFGALMSGIACVTTYITLRAARRPTPPGGAT